MTWPLIRTNVPAWNLFRDSSARRFSRKEEAGCIGNLLNKVE
jgi:hypothetical protein